jgi:hypothetical protein
MLMDEALHFMRLGTFLERADNTARLVDVKFHAVQSDFFGAATLQDQEYDFYHWSAILRSVSGFEVYRKVYRDVIRPERVAELLVLRGGAEAIERFRPKLLIEFNAKTLAAAQTSAAEIAGWLGARRYHLYEIAPENGELSPVRLVPVGPSRNLLALPAP